MLPVRSLIPLLAAVALAPAASTPAASAATDAGMESAGVRDIIVAREAGLTRSERRAVRARVDGVLVDTLRLADTEVIRVPADAVASALAELNADPDVRFAELDAPIRASTADEYWPLLWGLSNTGQNVFGKVGTADADIDAEDAWQTTTGAGVVVAVADSGVDLAHPDLASQIAGNPRERGAGREANGVDDDGNGLIDDWQGWDFVTGAAEADGQHGKDNTPGDADGHGTHVSGTIAAVADNGEGVVGVAPGARILPLRVLNADGTGTTSALVEAFDYAGDLGVRVVNASLGGERESLAVRDVMRAHPATVFVTAAGNRGADVDLVGEYPCASAAPNVLCVGASDNQDVRDEYSNYGDATVDVFAPGVDIASTYLTSDLQCAGYCYETGTSMAAPHAAGAAALVAAVYPALDGSAIRQQLIATADPRPGLPSVARGRVNAATAVRAPAPVTPTPTPTPAPALPPAPSPTPAPAPSPVVEAPRPDGLPGGTVPDTRPAPPRLSTPRRTVALRGRSVAVTIRSSLTLRATIELTRRGSRASLHRRSARLKAGVSTIRLARHLPGRTLRAGRYTVTVSAPGAADLKITLLVA
jgi:subtilisin family serine protease